MPQYNFLPLLQHFSPVSVIVYACDSVGGTDPDLVIRWNTKMFHALWTLRIFAKQGAEMGDRWASAAVLLRSLQACTVCGMVYFSMCSKLQFRLLFLAFFF